MSRPSRSRRLLAATEVPVEALGGFLRQETTSGQALLLATAVALVWANVSAGSYASVWDSQVAIGPQWLELDLALSRWASDGLLALFFFIAGLEVKREFVCGELADRRAAMLPFCAAMGGVVVPALVTIAVTGGASANGGAWAIPVATDIAFALGVLALAGSALPSGVRVVLLSMAVIDDVIAIALIAVLFTSGLEPAWLLGGTALAIAWRGGFRLGWDRSWLLWPLAIATWVCVHASGVHATITGVLLALLTPVTARAHEHSAPSERFEHRLHPISAGVVVPAFAVAACGIPLSSMIGIAHDRIALSVLAGLLLGKFAGIFTGAWLAVRLGLASLPEHVGWGDVVPVAVLGGIGYTVSLLIVQLALEDAAAQDRAAAAVLTASVIASLVAVMLLRRRPSAATRDRDRDRARFGE